MAKQDLHEQALQMRKEGMSYSQIKEELGVSKSTLSLWLRDMPLPEEKIRELRDLSPQRIERYRNTRMLQRMEKEELIFKGVSTRIGDLSERELFLAGLFLYWAEGTKAMPGTVALTNTDPAMLKFFIRWLILQGTSKDKIMCKLHLYSDMDIDQETMYWSEMLDVPCSAFRKPYIKESKTEKRKNYKGRFGHGTCNLIVHDMRLYNLIIQGIKYIGGEASIGFPVEQRV